jgi:hypothetical protein
MPNTDHKVSINTIANSVGRVYRPRVCSPVTFASLVAILALCVAFGACNADPSPAQNDLTSASHNVSAASASSSSAGAAASALATNPYAKTPSQVTAVAGLAAPPASSLDVPQPLLTHLQKGQPYSAFRQQALANGWQPVATAMCKANVVGGNYKSLCASHPELNSCRLCDQMPELNSCSGDGYCSMQFRHTGTPEIMQVSTHGDTRDWMHADSSLRVTDWAFSKTPEQ